DIICFGSAFPLYRLEDTRELLTRSQVEGIFLEPKEILQLLELVEVSIGLHGYDPAGRGNFPAISEHLARVRAFPELRTEIRKVIDEDGRVRDNASPALRRIRQDLAESRRAILARLERILAGQQKLAGWQDDVITIRNGRYVIPVPTSQYRTGSGILHDRSQSGATLFVEPEQTVEMNNRINLLMQEERLELDRILRALTAEIASRAAALLENTRIIGKLDAIHACAQFSRQVGGNQPRLHDEPTFDLIDTRHPLLIVQQGANEKVVPMSLGLGGDRQAVLVTGPNTGGKTIALKTIGLSVLMAQSGLHISADANSSVGIFEKLFADVGDEQSIELSLSTFSSHMRNIVHALSGASERALLLFDEIGAGTDPKEGSALAQAIILHAVGKKARLVATTHYSQLKILATEHPEIENASLEFDRATLAPTFRLHLGIPGASYAVEIASRLGLPPEICQDASTLIGSTEKSLDALVASLQAELAKLKQDRSELTDRLAKTRKLEEYYRQQSDRLNQEIQSEKKRALEETEQFLEQTRKEMEKLVAEVRSSQAAQPAVKSFHQQLKQRQQQVQEMRIGLEHPDMAGSVFAKGDQVEILTLRQQGEITQILRHDRAKVKVGSILTTVELRNLRKLGATVESKAPRRRGTVSIEDVPRPEIHLRGMTVEEATENLEKFLDRAVAAGLSQIYIVHGKGTGALRRSLTAYLKGHPHVASVRLGDWNEGGAGVTIARLKE
ncbi:MAG TPA: endonuclease MutS2, partial [Candidatus Deferrimicrobium sp.]|nr:endonuclease MutS2 [Candidatus Deferrimicrobium sp.]